MKKVLEDGTLGISMDDRFPAPPGMHLDLDCDGSDNDASRQGQARAEKEAEEYYFD